VPPALVLLALGVPALVLFLAIPLVVPAIPLLFPLTIAIPLSIPVPAALRIRTAMIPPVATAAAMSGLGLLLGHPFCRKIW